MIISHCSCDGNPKSTARFVRNKNKTFQTRTHDDCLYNIYFIIPSVTVHTHTRSSFGLLEYYSIAERRRTRMTCDDNIYRISIFIIHCYLRPSISSRFRVQTLVYVCSAIENPILYDLIL